jgi:hypothetical protein
MSGSPGARRDGDRVGDYADDSYLRLTAGDAGNAGDATTPGDDAVRAALAESGASLAVVCDGEGHPLLLFTRTGRVPLVMIDAAEPMSRVLAGDVVSLLTSGIPALVVVEQSRVAGILTAETVSRYIVNQPVQYRGLLGDEQLHGPAVVTPLTLTCSTCGTQNTVTFYVAGKTPCSQGHPLTLPWD